MIHNDPLRELDLNMTRRQLFGKTALGLGTMAMADLAAAENPNFSYSTANLFFPSHLL